MSRGAARLEGELVVCGLHDARRASPVAPVLERLSSHSLGGSPAEALAVAQGMAMVLAGRPADETAAPLAEAPPRAAARAENWDTRAALLCSLVAAERFDAVGSALEPMVAEVHRSGSLGRAWVESDGKGDWRRKRGRSPDGALTEAEASERMLSLAREHDAEQTLLERDAKNAAGAE